jgi:trk system potassium uptake protein TrkH
MTGAHMNGTEGYKSLVYAVRPRVLGRIGGQFATVVAVLCLPPALVAGWFGEWRYLVTLVPVTLLLFVLGWLARRLPEPTQLLTSEGYVLTCGAFIGTPLVMSAALAPSGLPPATLFFETVSAITTTGLSNVGSVEGLDRTFLFMRSWMQWYGGLGIVILSVTMLMRRSLAASHLLELPEGEGFVTAAMVYARRALKTYLALTVAAMLLCWWSLGFGFDGLLHALSAISTGGFSSADDSLTSLPFPAQLGIMAGGLAGAVSLAVYLRIWQGGWRQVMGNRELRTFIVLLFILCTALSIMISASGTDSTHGLEQGVIMGVSALTTTGFSNVEPRGLHDSVKLLLIVAMLLGGCLGSTAGGFKMFRLRLVGQVLMVTLRKASATSHAVIEPQEQGKLAGDEHIREVMLLGLLLVVACVLSWLPFLFYDFAPLDALFEVASALGTVGLSSGVASPDLPVPLKGVLCFDMVAGRVELIALISLLYPRLWIGRRYKEL